MACSKTKRNNKRLQVEETLAQSTLITTFMIGSHASSHKYLKQHLFSAEKRMMLMLTRQG
jgi:hypothetical protein